MTVLNELTFSKINVKFHILLLNMFGLYFNVRIYFYKLILILRNLKIRQISDYGTLLRFKYFLTIKDKITVINTI